MRWMALALISILGASGCATVSGSAAPLTPRGFTPTRKAVYVHTVGSPPPGLQMLGLVDARAAGHDATVDRVIPELIRQAQRLGATDVILDDLHMEYRYFTGYTSYHYRCGWVWCSDMAPVSSEAATLVATGRAFGPAGSSPAAPASAGEKR